MIAFASKTFCVTYLVAQHHPTFWPASITGGMLRTWEGRYKGLVDGSGSDRVSGQAYQVLSKQHEEVLLFFETEIYETVRCTIMVKSCGVVVQGLTFKFLGRLDDET